MPISLRTTLVVSAFALTPLLAPGIAGASTSIVPPGNSGASQYVEVVPSAGGGQPVDTGTSHKSPLSSAERQHLAAAGTAGAQLAAFVADTGTAAAKPTSGGSNSGQGSGHGSGHGKTTSKPSGRATGVAGLHVPPLPAAVPTSDVVGASGGLGLGLPLVLAATALLAIAGALLRRRFRAG